jgi:hypothetical protein
MTNSVIKYVEENPLAAGLISLVAGLVVGMALPQTKSEADLITGIREKALAGSGRAVGQITSTDDYGA